MKRLASVTSLFRGKTALTPYMEFHNEGCILKLDRLEDDQLDW